MTEVINLSFSMAHSIMFLPAESMEITCLQRTKTWPIGGEDSMPVKTFVRLWEKEPCYSQPDLVHVTSLSSQQR